MHSVKAEQASINIRRRAEAAGKQMKAQVKNFSRIWIGVMKRAGAGISGRCRNLSVGQQAFWITLFCIMSIVMIYTGFTGQNPWTAIRNMAAGDQEGDFLRLVSFAVAGLTGLWGLLWRNFIGSRQLGEQIAQGKRVELQIAKTEAQMRLTGAKNNADLFAKSCEMVGKEKAAEITGGISLLVIAAKQEEGKYAGAALDVLQHIAALNDGAYVKTVIFHMLKINMLYNNIYTLRIIAAFSEISALHDGKYALPLLRELRHIVSLDKHYSGRIIDALSGFATLYDGRYRQETENILHYIAETGEANAAAKAKAALAKLGEMRAAAAGGAAKSAVKGEADAAAAPSGGEIAEKPKPAAEEAENAADEEPEKIAESDDSSRAEMHF